MPVNLPVKMLSGRIQDTVDAVHGQILHTAALVTDKMIVRAGIRIKAVGSVAQTQTLDLAHIRQQSQITVYRAQADIGNLLPDIHIYNICRGMIVAAHKKLLDHLPLPAVFQRHTSPSQNDIDNGYCFIITY